MVVFALPSPSQGVWHLGPLPIRAYALCIILGIAAAIWLGERRWRSAGRRPGVIMDVAVWAVPFGVVGGRLYHVVTDPELYFTSGHHPWSAFEVWRGGLGIWGAITLGGIGAWIGTHRAGVRFEAVAWALAPAVPLAQAIGRWGNWFNQELFGRPSDLPWAVRISPEHRPPGYEGTPTFQPTFLYESLWDLAVAAFVVWCGHRFSMRGDRLVAVYVMAYTVGRAWIEYLRIDTANHILGLRLNLWTSAIVFVLAATYFVVTRERTSSVAGDDRAEQPAP